eukprot:12542507-Alexandrium_andersonii.AAC.1
MLKSLKALEPETARTQERPQDLPPKLPRGAFSAVVRTDAESADEMTRRRAFSGGSGGVEPPLGSPVLRDRISIEPNRPTEPSTTETEPTEPSTLTTQARKNASKAAGEAGPLPPKTARSQ